nr:ATP synthase F0 subunit 8 [Picromerus lewisi]QZP40897.1 ATP synthase F0 subunit 8 [Picromerus lewisi]URT60191.1 ATP synthase F0 subunit 8 [Picromerus lewisi]
MSPLWWEILFIIFSLTYLMFSIMIYFYSKYNKSSKSLNYKKSNNLNWLW